MGGSGNTCDEEKLLELRETHEAELRRLKAEVEAITSKHIAEIEELQEKNTHYAEQAQNGSEEHITEITLLKEKLAETTTTITALNE